MTQIQFRKPKADLGKKAEGEVRKRLVNLSKFAHTSGRRIPDARSGALTSAIADYEILSKGVMYYIEVKEVDHEYRLPHKNFDADQVARMRRQELAGAYSFALVYFTPLAQWRGAHVNYFLNRDGASWDMRDLQLAKLDEFLGTPEQLWKVKARIDEIRTTKSETFNLLEPLHVTHS